MYHCGKVNEFVKTKPVENKQNWSRQLAYTLCVIVLRVATEERSHGCREVPTWYSARARHRIEHEVSLVT